MASLQFQASRGKEGLTEEPQLQQAPSSASPTTPLPSECPLPHWLPFPTFQPALALAGRGSVGRRDSFISGHLKEHESSLPVKQPSQWRLRGHHTSPTKPGTAEQCLTPRILLHFTGEKTSPRGCPHPTMALSKSRPLKVLFQTYCVNLDNAGAPPGPLLS